MVLEWFAKPSTGDEPVSEFESQPHRQQGINMIAVSNYYGEGLYAARESKVFIEDDVPTVEFWDNGQFIAVRAFPDNTLQYAEDAAENYILGILKL